TVVISDGSRIRSSDGLSSFRARKLRRINECIDGYEPGSRRPSSLRNRSLDSGAQTLPFLCPLLTPRGGLKPQRPTSDRVFRSWIEIDFIEADLSSGVPTQLLATRCKSVVFRLLTGGLLVRIQPEEPIPLGPF